MTDSANNSVETSLEALVTKYVEGVANSESTDPIGWLTARSEIEARKSELTEDQMDEIEDADEDLSLDAAEVASALATSGRPLSGLRGNRPPNEWWWYLDVIQNVTPKMTEAVKPKPSTASRLVDIALLVVLVIAVGLLLWRVLPTITPNLFQPPAPTPMPSWTPAPTATLDPSAFDMTNATAFKDPANVVAISLPKGWSNIPTKPGDSPIKQTYRFAYGPADAPTITIDLFIDQPQSIYNAILELPSPADTPQAALDVWKKALAANPSLKIGDIKPAKLGKVDGYSLAISVQAQAGGQGGGQEVEVRVAPLEGGQIALVFVQSRSKALWDQAQAVIPKMLESLVINLSAIPTPTPTFTPHPLELTATVINNAMATNRAQILALTPTITPTPAPTSAATAAATGAATSAATAAATSAATPAPAATSAATTAPTAAATTAATSEATAAATAAATK